MGVCGLDAEHTVATIVDFFRKEIDHNFKSRRDGEYQTALLVSVELRANYWGYLEDGNTLNFIFHGNVHVWCGHTIGKLFFGNILPMEEWENTSNHDSCWRSDGLRKISSTYFALCDEVQNHLPDKLKVAPKDISMFNTLEGFRFVDIKFDRRGGNDYKYDLLEVKERPKV